MSWADAGAWRVGIGICTCGRRQGLLQLLAAIDRMRLGDLQEAQVLVIVVDNSSGGDARSFVDDYAIHGRLAIAYRHEPRRGVSFARNAVLAVARDCGVSHIASIDDDEMPHPDWVWALVQACANASATMAIGPVRPVFQRPPPRWLPTSAYETRRRPRDGLVSEGYTCNALISMRAVEDAGASFDQKFNESGGEDTAFFHDLVIAGIDIAWADQALVYETIPRARMSLRWLLRRWYLTGLNQGRLSMRERSDLVGRLHNGAQGLVRLFGGGARSLGTAIVWIWRRPDRVVLSCYTPARGIGLIAAAFGARAGDYTQRDYR